MLTEERQAVILLKELFPLARFERHGAGFLCYIKTSHDLHRITVDGTKVWWKSWFYDFHKDPHPYVGDTRIRQYEGSWITGEIIGWLCYVKDQIADSFEYTWDQEDVFPLPKLAELCWRGESTPTKTFPKYDIFSATYGWVMPHYEIRFVRPGEPLAGFFVDGAFDRHPSSSLLENIERDAEWLL